MTDKEVPSPSPLPTPTRRRMHGPDYTPDELAEKDSWMKRLSAEWSDLTPFQIELVYDFCAKTPQAEIDEIMAKGSWDGPSKYSPEETKKILDRYTTN